MFKGFYTAGSGMIAQQRRTELLANNLSNARTPGFKEDRSTIRSFPEMFLARMDEHSIPTQRPLHRQGLAPVGGISTGVYMQETLPSFIQGSLLATELPTDVALVDIFATTDPESGEKGTFFFRIEGPNNQEQYTRNGSFALGPNRELMTSYGAYVLDSNGGRIQLTNDDFSIDQDGRVSETGQVLGIAFSQNPSSLIKQDNGVFVHPNGEQLPDISQEEVGMYYQIQQGYIESSNVDSGRTMTDMMTAYRSFEANSKVLQAYDRSMEKSVELGRIN